MDPVVERITWAMFSVEVPEGIKLVWDHELDEGVRVSIVHSSGIAYHVVRVHRWGDGEVDVDVTTPRDCPVSVEIFQRHMVSGQVALSLAQLAQAELNRKPSGHEHKAVSSVFVPSGHYLRRTGVTMQETCSCGMQRHVWLTTFKVDAGAWSTP